MIWRLLLASLSLVLAVNDDDDGRCSISGRCGEEEGGKWTQFVDFDDDDENFEAKLVEELGEDGRELVI